jgi:hypothetical protein
LPAGNDSLWAVPQVARGADDRDPQGCDEAPRAGERSTTSVVVCACITEHKGRFRVAPIFRLLIAHGCKIAPRPHYAHLSPALSKWALWVTTITEVLAGHYEPDEDGRRKPEALYESLKM